MKDIVVTYELAHPVEQVWDALTDSRQLSEWLMPNDFEPRLGHSFTFRTDPAPGFDGIVHCTVLDIDPPRRLVLSWRGGPLDTTVSFDLAAMPGGTRLTLRHAGFKGLSNLMPRFFLGMGWKGKVQAKLKALLAGRPGSARAA